MNAVTQGVDLRSARWLRHFRTDLRRTLAQKRLLDFTCYTKHDYRPTWFHELVATKLDRVLDWIGGDDTGIQNLAVSLPPQHGKSELCSRRLPAMALGRFPGLPVMMTSYGDNLATFNANSVRGIIASPEFGELFPGVELGKRTKEENRYAEQRANLFHIARHGGRLLSTGIMGSLGGFGFELGIFDDPIKNAEQADSPAYREKLVRQYEEVFTAREMSDRTAKVVPMTRWRTNDLWAHIMEMAERSGDRWEVVSLPAIQDLEDPPEYDQREFGEGLWHDRHLDEWYERKRASVDPRTWNALWQQRPTDEQGDMFKRQWWRYYTDRPETFDSVFQMWDLGFKKTGRSYVVGMVFGGAGPNLYALDHFRDHLDFTESCDAIRSMSSKWPDAWDRLVEDKANGPAVITTLKGEVGGVQACEYGGVNDSKEGRASAALPKVRSGNVLLPAGAPWVPGFIDELAAFPKGAHDDQVDVLAHAVNWYHQSGANWLKGMG